MSKYVTTVTRDIKEVEAWLEANVSQSNVICGIDAEWTPSCLIAVLQIATNDQVLVYQLDQETQSNYDCLIHFLTSPSVLKVGVGIAQDARRILSTIILCHPDNIKSVCACIDLSTVASESFNFKNKSLVSLTQSFINPCIKSWKSKSLSCSDWTRNPLSQEQVQYAATDAHMSLLVFQAMHKKNDETIFAFGKRYAHNVTYEPSPCKKLPKGTCAPPINDAYEVAKATRRRAYDVRASRKSALYENCQLLAPDGSLLARCSVKKLEWYIRKGLAVRIEHSDNDNDDGTTDDIAAKLLFEPSGRVLESCKEYVLSDKANVCVSCGSTQHLIRHYVVPYAIRSEFTLAYKSHNSHDICLVCTTCHLRIAPQYHQHLKDLETSVLASDSNTTTRRLKYLTDATQVAISKAAKALLYHYDSIPKFRREQLLSVVKQSDVDSSNLEEIISVAESKILRENPEYVPLERDIVTALEESSCIPSLIRGYRKMFKEELTQGDLYLPEGWSIEHKLDEYRKIITPACHRDDSS